MDPTQDLRDSRLTVDLQVAIGGGYGRVIDVGGAIRVRRLSRTLDDARALGRPIDAAIARKPSRPGGRCAASASAYARWSRPSRSCARPASCSASPTPG